MSDRTSNTPRAEAAVWAQDLTRTFGTFTAVDHITFSVGKGEVFGSLGANGAGKTTAIKMLTGLLVPTSGAAYTAGHNVATETEAVKRRIGYMSQRFALYDDLKTSDFTAASTACPTERSMNGWRLCWSVSDWSATAASASGEFRWVGSKNSLFQLRSSTIPR